MTLALTLAIADSDQVRDVVHGDVRVEGVELTCLRLPVEEIFWRFSHYREWDVSEYSLGKFVALRGRDDPDAPVAIPVFPSRVFRHSAFFVRADGGVRAPAELRGRRIGIPEWTLTAVVWGRGLLAEEYGVGLDEVEWVQAGVNEPGRAEGIPSEPPTGVRLTAVADRSLEELLLAGEVDAVLSARPPAAVQRGDGRVVRLFPDAAAVEEAYFRKTGVFPIMHLLAVRRDVYEANRWLAMELLKAFEEAKERSLTRMRSFATAAVPLPWGAAHAEHVLDVLGPDPWPYGTEPNRATLETFLRYARDQGLTGRLLRPEELFVPEVQSQYRV